MKIYQLDRVQYLPMTMEEAWQFFSSPLNLSKITPPEMRFVVHTQLKRSIYEGMKIEYTVRPLLGIPLRWITEIKKVNEPHSFTDTQRKGPYALWEHTHTFEAVPGGVKMTDNVRYALPMGILGTMMHTLVVRKKLTDLFAFRERTLVQFFGAFT